MKRGAKAPQKRRQPFDTSVAGVQVEIDCQVLRDIRKHARSSLSVEICGVLIGTTDAGKTTVDASIPGEEARQGGSHVTFTQETWTHIYQVKDSQFPDKRIVGWYHSHPGFGVFLSEHDTFIHRNFFSDPSQVAWVYDPQNEEEGCFVWKGGEIHRLTTMALRDEPRKSERSEDSKADEFTPEEAQYPKPEVKSRRAHVVRWVALILSHIFALILGLLIGWIFAPRVVLIPDNAEHGSVVMAPHSRHSERSTAPEEGKQK